MDRLFTLRTLFLRTCLLTEARQGRALTHTIVWIRKATEGWSPVFFVSDTSGVKTPLTHYYFLLCSYPSLGQQYETAFHLTLCPCMLARRIRGEAVFYPTCRELWQSGKEQKNQHSFFIQAPNAKESVLYLGTSAFGRKILNLKCIGPDILKQILDVFYFETALSSFSTIISHRVVFIQQKGRSLAQGERLCFTCRRSVVQSLASPRRKKLLSEMYFVLSQVDKLEVVNKRFVRVVFTPGKSPIDGVNHFFQFTKCIKGLNHLCL